MFDAVQILGSLLILVAFVAALGGRLDQDSYRYLVLNVIGSGVLAVEAAMTVAWGFLLLEGVWTAVSLFSLVRRALAHAGDDHRTV